MERSFNKKGNAKGFLLLTHFYLIQAIHQTGDVLAFSFYIRTRNTNFKLQFLFSNHFSSRIKWWVVAENNFIGMGILLLLSGIDELLHVPHSSSCYICHQNCKINRDQSESNLRRTTQRNRNAPRKRK